MIPVMIVRIGVFLLWLGVFLLFVFFLTDVSAQPQYNLFLWGLLSLLLGLFMWRRFRKPPEDSQRFKMLRGLMGRRAPNDEGE